jgi:hypothetical protein
MVLILTLIRTEQSMIWCIELQLGSHPVAVVQYTYTHKQYNT